MNTVICHCKKIIKQMQAQAGEDLGYSNSQINLQVGQVVTGVALKLTRTYSEKQYAKSKNREISDFPNLWKGIGNIGQVLSLDDERFSAKNAKKALCQPLKFSMEVIDSGKF